MNHDIEWPGPGLPLILSVVIIQIPEKNHWLHDFISFTN